jgi:hypothetical protein
MRMGQKVVSRGEGKYHSCEAADGPWDRINGVGVEDLAGLSVFGPWLPANQELEKRESSDLRSRMAGCWLLRNDQKGGSEVARPEAFRRAAQRCCSQGGDGTLGKV